ncbi:calcium homeostasis modulator protein 6-like isoform X1 [Oncorhynchus nerka]|uniref:calcium homeostasis modulator protein 6-like isoform X1 n=1 Tax=Oncorhynchus nerka TaxID=8023 RepID=UPI00112FDACA|nr:calcium homeostasis modulator protein 6-like isoform X1 [Oncorhynchus nerka]
MDMFKTVLKIVQKQQTSLGFGLVALLTAGGEQIFSSVVFKCPCSGWNFSYGMVFLLVPALALLVLGYVMSNKTWKLFTGLCLRKSKLCRFKYFCACGVVFFQITTTAVVAPVSWIAVALLNGNYFECAMTGINVTVFTNHLCDGKSPQCQDELYKFPCRSATHVPQSDSNDVLATLHAESQVLGWLLIASIMVFNLLLTCVARCNSPVSYLQLKFWRVYAQRESDLLESYTADHAEKLAERNLKSFFQQMPPEPVTTPPSHAWEKISSLYRFSTRDHYYSILHKYVEKCQDPAEARDHRMSSVRSDGPDTANPSVLTFVDEGKMML